MAAQPNTNFPNPVPDLMTHNVVFELNMRTITKTATLLGRPMRSLTVKLTLAFLLVGTIGATLVAVLVGLRTRSEFDRFLSERDQGVLVAALSGYYASHAGWAG